MRSEILVSAVLCDVEETVKEAKARFHSWMTKNTRIPPNLREVVYSAGKSKLFTMRNCLLRHMKNTN